MTAKKPTPAPTSPTREERNKARTVYKGPTVDEPSELPPPPPQNEVLSVIKPGEKAILNDHPVTILQIMVCQNLAIEYQVVWYKDSGRETQWVHAHEIEPFNGSEKLQIGFR